MLAEYLGSRVTIGEQELQIIGQNPFGYWAECLATKERIVLPGDIVDGDELDDPAYPDEVVMDMVFDF
jgi:hypothetical protein